MRFFVLSLLLSLTAQALASQICDKDWSNLSSPERLHCNAELSAKLEAGVKAAYATALKSLHAIDKNDDASNTLLRQKLIASQKAWEKYRVIQCAYLRDAMGEATEAQSWYLGCMQEMAEERIKWLEKSAR